MMFDPALEPALWQIIVASAVVGVLPVFTALVALPKVLKLSRAQQDKLRPQLYVEAIVLQWAILILGLSPVLFHGATLEQLGLTFSAANLPRVLIGAAIGCVLLAGFSWQRHLLLATAEGRAAARDAVSHLAWILPRSPGQRALWVVVSTHAGVCEEVFYRGFLFAALNWYLPVWAAAVISVLLFSLGHIYQGVKGVIGTAAIGAAMLALYAFTGSLWVSILLHAVYDMQGGEFGRRVLYGREPAA